MLLGVFAAGCPRDRLPFSTARSWAFKPRGVTQLTMAMLLLISP
ncbi:hypothetical protein [Streptomyces sp. NPDC005336]